MKTIVLAITLALAASASALARPAGAPMHHTRAIHHAMHAHPQFAAPDPYGVYVDGQEIGRDPDANIRSTLRDEYYQEQSGG